MLSTMQHQPIWLTIVFGTAGALSGIAVWSALFRRLRKPNPKDNVAAIVNKMASLVNAFDKTAPYFFTFIQRLLIVAGLFYVSASLTSTLYRIIFFSVTSIAYLYLLISVLTPIRKLTFILPLPKNVVLRALTVGIFIAVLSVPMIYLLYGTLQLVEFALSHNGIP